MLTAAISSIMTFLPSFFGAASCTNQDYLFNIVPAWYEFLTIQPDGMGGCEVANFQVPNDFLPVGLAVLDMLLRLGGLACMIGIIAAGVGYITAGGDAAKAATSRRRIYNAVIGLGIVFVASAFVAFVGNSLS